MDEEERRDDTTVDDDSLYEDLNEDASDDSGNLWSILNALPPGCLMAVLVLVGCLCVALPRIKR